MKKNTSFPRKQDKDISQNNEKFVKDFAAESFSIFKGFRNCYF